MLGDSSFIAIVPARGGSKSVPRKNIRMLGNAPLLVHTLRQIEQVPEIDRAVVTTDDAEIAEITRRAGGQVVLRPASLATDTAPTEPAMIHALDVLAKSGERFDYVMLLEPTSPFRASETIRRCMKKMVQSGASSLMTVTETRSNIGRLERDLFRPLVPGAPRRRQDRAPFYIESSTVYICRTEHLREKGTLVAEDWLAVVVPDAEAFDINSELDFAVAEAMCARSTEKVTRGS